MIRPNFTCIEENLYIGDSDAAANLRLLQKHKITHVLICGAELKAKFRGDFEYCKSIIYDTPTFQISDQFEFCCNFIAKAEHKEGKVLVYCSSGKSRSVTIVIAYLMSRSGYNFGKALQLMQKVHPISSPNNGFLKQLLEYEKNLFEKPRTASCCEVF